MKSERPAITPPCLAALAALEIDPLTLSASVEAHLRRCSPCSEARILLLAMEEAPEVAVPQGYFEGLGNRILRKLPSRRAGLRASAVVWLLAAGLLLALGLGTTGFYLGRAARAPMVEASLPQPLLDPSEQANEAPFSETEDPLSQLSTLSPAEAESALKRLQATPPARSGR